MCVQVVLIQFDEIGVVVWVCDVVLVGVWDWYDWDVLFV